MIHHVKKRAVLATLLLSAAVAVPAWSEDQAPGPAVQSQSGQGDGSISAATERAGEAAVTPAPEAGGSSDAAAPAAANEAAVLPAPETGRNADASSPATAGDAAAGNDSKPVDSGTYETATQPVYHPFDWVVFNPLWKVTGWIGDWNPIGNYVSAPIENAIRGFRFKGFINNITQINTTDDATVGVGKRIKDWWLQKQEVRISTELRYQATDQLQFVNVDNFQWDGAYNLQHSDGLFDNGTSNQVNYTQFKRIFREGYVQGNYGLINFTVGKQIVNWGKMDGKVLDFINASDTRDGVVTNITDYEWRAIGQWMAYLTLRPVETVSVSLLWNPDFQPNVGAAYGSPYYSPRSSTPSKPTPLTSEINPSGFNKLSQEELGGRIDSTLGPLSLSGIYYNGFDRDGVVFFTDKVKHHTRLNWYGLASDYATNIMGQRFGFRTEALYIAGKAYGTTDASVPNRVVYKDTLKTGVNFETSIGSSEDKYDLTFTTTWTRQLGYDRRTGASRHVITYIPGISHSVHATSDKLVLSNTWYISSGSTYNGLSYQLAGTWRFNDYLTAALKYNDYLGNDGDNSYGAYSKFKNITLDVKYEW